MLWDAARAPGGGAGLYIPYCGKRYPGTVHADGRDSPVHWRKMGCRFESGEWDSFRRNCRRDFWKPVRRFFYMVQMRKFITCRVNNRICLRKLFRSYPIRQMMRERSRCLCLNSRVQRELQRSRYVRQQTGRIYLPEKGRGDASTHRAACRGEEIRCAGEDLYRAGHGGCGGSIRSCPDADCDRYRESTF